MIELVVAMAVLSVLVVVGFVTVSVFTSVSQQGVGKGQGTFADNAALSDIRQQVVSSSVLFNPASETGSSCNNSNVSSGENCAGANTQTGYSIRVQTELDGVDQCVQWRLPTSGLNNGDLQMRTWVPGPSPTAKAGWQTIVQGLTNTGSAQKPFVLDPNFGSDLLDVELYSTGTNAPGSSVQSSSSIAARDLPYPQSGNNCNVEPAP